LFFLLEEIFGPHGKIASLFELYRDLENGLIRLYIFGCDHAVNIPPSEQTVYACARLLADSQVFPLDLSGSTSF
jgi:hypothetical protein